jgi:hypothetical protein
MTRDVILVVAMVVPFAVLVTAHVAIAFGLARRPPRWRALIALVVPPLAPMWALRSGMRARGVVWIASAVVYAVAVAIAL